MVEINERMREFLATYAEEFTPESVQHDVPLVYPWFPGEFEQLLRAHAFTPSVYGRVVHSRRSDTPEAWDSLDYRFRELWKAACADRPYPYDEPGVAPSELVDSLDERGLSRRLVRFFNRNYQRRPGHHFVHPKTIGRSVEDGGWGWLPGTLETQIRARVFTPEVWSDLIYGGAPGIDASTVDRDLRELWAGVAPGRPYPLDAE